jgi:hypothetical protein
METAKIVLEYIKVFLSPQAVAGLVAAIFLSRFRKDISALLGRIARIRFPGGEVSTSQAERPPEAETSLAKPPASSDVQLPQGRTLTPEQVDTIRKVFEAERARAALWEYRYLNYFLVPHTQQVLDWLDSIKGAPTVDLYDSIWIPRIPSSEERKAVLRALEAHALVTVNGPLIEVTEKGKQYREFRGSLLLPAT